MKFRIFIRIRSNKNSFPLDPSGKRSISQLKESGIDKYTYPFDYFYAKSFEKKDNKKLLLKGQK